MPMSKPTGLKVLLMSEDLDFSRRFAELASAQQIEVTTRRSLAELGSIGYLGHCDVLLADTLLGPLQGHEVAEYASAFFPGLPVLLAVDDTATALPLSVAGSFCKNSPLAPLFDAIARLSDESRAVRATSVEAPDFRVAAT